MTSEDLVYKTHVEPMTESAEASTSWWGWVDTRINRELEAVTESVGEILSEERQAHRQEIEKALAPLQRELAELRGQISTLVLLSGAKPADLASAIEAAKAPGPRGLQGPAGPKCARGERGVTGPSIVARGTLLTR